MRFQGVIRSLILERRPFAVLAILAALLPYVLSGTGLHGAPAGLRLTDGTLVICTADGFVRVGGDEGRARHDVNDCCKSGCIHAVSKTAIGPATVSQPVRFIAIHTVAWPPLGAGADASTADATPSIRAPPARFA